MGQGHIRRLLRNLNDESVVKTSMDEIRKANAAAYEVAIRKLAASQTEQKK
jgi:hypothetical protein